MRLKWCFGALVVPLQSFQKKLCPVMPGIYLGVLWGIVLVCVRWKVLPKKIATKGPHYGQENFFRLNGPGMRRGELFNLCSPAEITKEPLNV